MKQKLKNFVGCVGIVFMLFAQGCLIYKMGQQSAKKVIPAMHMDDLK